MDISTRKFIQGTRPTAKVHRILGLVIVNERGRLEYINPDPSLHNPLILLIMRPLFGIKPPPNNNLWWSKARDHHIVVNNEGWAAVEHERAKGASYWHLANLHAAGLRYKLNVADRDEIWLEVAKYFESVLGI